MFAAASTIVEPDRVIRYSVTNSDVPMTYADVLSNWLEDDKFCDFFTQLMIDAEFAAYRWETPPLTGTTSDAPFEFVLVNTPGFITRATDDKTYEDYFTNDDTDRGVVAFANLSGDAMLVVPSPRTDVSAYGHLAAFVRNAPREQANALWRVVARAVQVRRTEQPLWLNTAGGGVAWLHVRLDSRPKYLSLIHI